MKLTKVDLKIAIEAAEAWPLKHFKNWVVGDDKEEFDFNKKKYGKPGIG